MATEDKTLALIRNAECAAHIVLPGPLPKSHLTFRPLDADERPRRIGLARCHGYHAGQFGGLVEPSGKEATTMKGHWQHQIAMRQRLGAGPRHPPPDHLSEICPVPVFECVDQRSGNAEMQGHGAQAIEVGRFGNCERGDSRFAVIMAKGNAEHRAMGFLNPDKRLPAGRADAVMTSGEDAATGAMRRIEQVCQTGQGPAGKGAEACGVIDASAGRNMTFHFRPSHPHQIDIAPQSPARRCSSQVRTISMEALFDTDLIHNRRIRALRHAEDGADFLMRLVAEELGERLAVVERQFDEAVELHGVTGAVGEACLATGRIGKLRRIELPEAYRASASPVEHAPLEILPLEAGSVNLVLSPLALHLTNDFPGVLIQARRALKPDGLFLAAIPGAGTLAELKDALLAAEIEITGGASPRVIPFADVRDIGGLLQRAGFALPVVDVETKTVRYYSMFALMRDLKNMGMSNPLINRSRRPGSRQLFVRAAEIYAERYSDPDGRVRATFSFIFASGWAPHESQQKPLKPGSAKARLADALKVKPD